MADTAVAITAGSGTNIDTRTEATNGNHRQVIVVGDPSTNAGVAPVDATTGLVVNIGPGVDLGSGTGGSKTPRVLIDSSQLGALGRAAAASSASVALSNEDKTALVDDAAFTPGTSNVNVAGFQADETATDSVDEGDAGAARMTLDRKQIVTVQPHTAGGLSIFRSLDLDETEEDVKTSAGCLYKLRLTNFATSVRYVKLYNATAANTTVGTTTPIDTIPVPAGSSTAPTVITESFGGLGLTFDTALCVAATTALADNDAGAPAANDVVVSAYYK